MKFLSILFFLPLFAFSQGKISISIELKGMPDNMLFYLSEDKVNVDSAISKNEKLYFSYRKINGDTKGIIIVTKDKRHGYLIWIENKSLSLHGQFGDLTPLSADGSSSQNDFKEYRELTLPLENTLDSVRKKFNLARFENHSDSSLYKLSIESLSEKLKSINIEFLKSHNNSIISTYMLLLETTRKTFTKAESLDLFNKLQFDQQNSRYGQDILRSIQLYQNPKVGQEAPAFSMTDITGQQISLADYKGKNVILIFWASWCMPCRAELPTLKAAYESLKKDSVIFIGVSLDEKKESWKKAVDIENIPWINISDLNGWTNDVALTYGVTSIPDHFFINKAGLLINRQQNFRTFEQFVQAYLKN